MNPAKRHRWEFYSYLFILFLSLAMLALTISTVARHCRNVLALDSSPGSCGVGMGWFLICIAFIAIAGYSGYQVYVFVQSKQAYDGDPAG